MHVYHYAYSLYSEEDDSLVLMAKGDGEFDTVYPINNKAFLSKVKQKIRERTIADQDFNKKLKLLFDSFTRVH